MTRASPVLLLLLGLVLALPAGARPRDEDSDHPRRDERGHKAREWRGDDRHDGGHGQGESRRMEGRGDWRESGGRARERAAERARNHSRGGRVLSAEPDGDRRYRVRVLTPDGYIRNLDVDPGDED